MENDQLTLNRNVLSNYRPCRVLDLSRDEEDLRSGRDGGLTRIQSVDVHSSSQTCVTIDKRKTIRLLDLNKGEFVLRRTDAQAEGNLVRCTHHPSAILYPQESSDRSRSINYYSMQDHTVLVKFVGHSGRVLSMAINRMNDTFVSSDILGKVMFWDLKSKSCVKALDCCFGMTLSYPFVAMNPNGMECAIITKGDVGSCIRLYDVRKVNRFYKTLTLLNSKIKTPFIPLDLSFSNDGSKLLIVSESHISVLQNKPIWDEADLFLDTVDVPSCSELLHTVDRLSGQAKALKKEERGSELASFDPSGNFFAAACPMEPDRLSFFDANDTSLEGPVHTVSEQFRHPIDIENVKWAPTSEVVVTTSPNSLVLWQAR